MVVTITCCCNSTFEIKDGPRHPKEIICPNCGSSLPHGASEDLFSALSSFSQFEAKLDDGSYEFSISK